MAAIAEAFRVTPQPTGVPSCADTDRCMLVNRHEDDDDVVRAVEDDVKAFHESLRCDPAKLAGAAKALGLPDAVVRYMEKQAAKPWWMPAV